MFTPAVMQTEVEILNEETYYVRFGDWFAWAITIAVAGLILFHLKQNWKNKRGLSAPKISARSRA
jgi:apolipoprotein N-acyltransferase